jgi:hypothetical protein
MQQPKDERHQKPRTLHKQIAERTFRISVSLNREEHERINAAAALGGIGIAAYVRAMIFRGRLIARLTEEEKTLFREMIGVSRDLNRLIRIAQEQGMSDVLPALAFYRDSVDKLLNKIKL